MEINEKFKELLCSIKEKKPLVHHITNYVSANDCANIVLAIGGSPVMADAIEEVEDMVSISSVLIINIGTLNSTKVESMVRAGKKANKIGVPVILDPVGVGATTYRKETASRLIKEVKFSVIRGNLAEIKILNGMNSLSKGVDSEEIQFDDAKNIAKDLALKLNTVVAITGKVDYISDGSEVIIIKNGHEMLASITGTGCMCTSLIGTYSSVTKDYLIAASAGIMTMGIAGELAFKRLSGVEGIGSFRMKLMDAIYNFSSVDIDKLGNAHEK